MEWKSIKDELPLPYTLVKVKLTNGIIKTDFINEPLDNVTPFQHYIVSEWRYLTIEELREITIKIDS